MIRTPWWFPMLLGLICIGIGFPAEKLVGLFFSLTGIALLLIGYGKSRRDAEERGDR